MFCSWCLDKVRSFYDDDDDDNDDDDVVLGTSNSKTSQQIPIDTSGPLPPLDTTQWGQPIYISAHPVVNIDHDKYKEQPLPLATPVEFETDLFKGIVFFRLRDVPSPHDKVHTQYFEGRKRHYQVMIQGQFKEELNMKDILIGDYYSKPMENIPRGVIGLSFMRMYERFMQVLSPGIVIDLLSSKPKILTSFGGVQTLRVDLPGEEPTINGDMGNIKEDTTLLLGDKFRDNIQKRRKYLSSPENSCKYVVNPEHVYSFEMYDHSMNFGTYHQHIVGGRRVDIVQSLNGQALAFACFTRDKRCIFKFPVWHERMILDMTSRYGLSAVLEDESLSSYETCMSTEVQERRARKGPTCWHLLSCRVVM